MQLCTIILVRGCLVSHRCVRLCRGLGPRCVSIGDYWHPCKYVDRNRNYFRVYQQKVSIKFYSCTQYGFRVNRCDWYNLAFWFGGSELLSALSRLLFSMLPVYWRSLLLRDAIPELSFLSCVKWKWNPKSSLISAISSLIFSACSMIFYAYVLFSLGVNRLLNNTSLRVTRHVKKAHVTWN